VRFDPPGGWDNKPNLCYNLSPTTVVCFRPGVLVTREGRPAEKPSALHISVVEKGRNRTASVIGRR